MDAIKDKRLKVVQYSGGTLISFNLLNGEAMTTTNFIKDDAIVILSNMITIVGGKLFNRIIPRVMLPYTRELEVSYIDSDTAMDYFKFGVFTETRLASSNSYTGRGRHYLLISKSKLLSIPNIVDQYLYILDCQYESMRIFFEKFNIPLNGLKASYEMLKTDDFYVRGCKPGTHKKKNLMAGVSLRVEIEKNVYLFKVLDENYQIIFSQDLSSVPHECIIMADTRAKNLDLMELIEKKERPITGYLGNGWKKDVFYFTWGDPESSKDAIFYEFHLSSMVLKRMN